MVVLRGNDVTLSWTITKCIDGTEVPEDFSGANLTVYLQTLYGKKVTEASADGNVLTIRIAGNKQQNGQVGVEAIWSKNDGKNWSRARENRVLDFTDNPALVTRCPGNASVDVHTIEVKSSIIGGIGYDGITPHIGDNGNWWVGDSDTGVPATGERGAPFAFDDFTPNQIDDLKRPAVEAGVKAEKDVAGFVNAAKEEVEDLRKLTVSAVDSVRKVEKAISENELQRAKTEQVRTQSEQERHVSEQHRVSSESTRVTAESGRTQSEAKRVSAEGERVSAEQLRVKAESNRLSEETKRVSAEQGREKAETKRVADSSEAIKQCDVATQGAKTQGDYAKEQGDAAKQAAIGAIDAKMALFIDMWDSACGTFGKYNHDTKFFELNGLTDISYKEALDIYQRTINLFMLSDIKPGWLGGTLRTNLPARTLWNGIGNRNLSLYGCSIIKLCCRSLSKFPGESSNVIPLNSGIKSLDVYNTSTIEIDGVIRFAGDQFITEHYDSGLKSVRFSRLEKGASFAKWGKLTDESVLYMISNANNTSPVTFTFHPTVYARAIANQEIVDKAVEKNITIASA